MSKPTVALAMIVEGDKSVAPMLEKALGSVNGYVDAIYIQVNAPKGKKPSKEVMDVANRFGDVVYEYIWTGNFVDARNDVFSKVDKKYDYIMWLDVDDTIENPEQIQPVLAILPDSISGLYILYDYAHDDAGNVTISHWTSRVVRNNGTFTWKSSIDDDVTAVHETLNPKRQVRSVSNNEWKVVHHADAKRREASLFRNIDLLQSMYERQSKKGEIDPRILFYLATHLYDVYDFKVAKNLFADYLQLSGWNEERSEAHVYLGKILKMQKSTNPDPKTAFLMAIGENPKNVNAYLELARIDFEMNRYNQAVEWLRIAVDIKQEITPMVRFNNQYQIYSMLAESLVNIGGKSLDEALKWITKAYKLRPYDEQLKEARDRVLKLLDYRDNMKATNRLVRALEKEDKSKIIPLLNALPEELNDSAPVVTARQHHTPPRKWPRKSIAIYVGDSSLGLWGPWSLNEGGIGGSEEAVVRLSYELQKLDWNVTVYGTPGKRAGFYGNVEWKQYWEFNPKDKFDVLIAWRQPEFFDFKFKARKKYLWLHDVVPKEEFTKERIKNFDKAIFVSQYHADRPEFVDIPKSKKFVSANGITPTDFTKLDGTYKRDPHRLIYMSANERGLRILYDIWPEVKKAVPKATLDVYYGWESFDAINRDNPERMMWKATMQDKARKLNGVTERDRIGQDDLNKEIFKSGIWAYPSFFSEVNCITGQKAMAGGAIPVTSDYAVLKDIVSYGEQVPMHDFQPQDIEVYKNHLISWLLYPEKQDRIRKQMMEHARKNFDWRLTAAGWDKEME